MNKTYGAILFVPVTQEFVCVNGYSFDLLYRRHHPLDPQNNGDEINTRENEITTSDNFYSDDKHEMVRREGGNAGGAFPPSLLASRKGGRGDHGGRLEEVMREENNTVLDGMTPNARELYQVKVYLLKRETHKTLRHLLRTYCDVL